MNRRPERASRLVPKSIKAAVMEASLASISISVRGLFLTVCRMSTCHTGRKRRLRRVSPANRFEICANRACMLRPISRRGVESIASSQIS
jgi:hypothetical protein